MNSLTTKIVRLVTWIVAAACPLSPVSASPATTIVREIVERACAVSGRDLAERGARDSIERSVAGVIRREGVAAGRSLEHGGVELLEAAARHGDDVLAVAKHAGPAGQRALALETDRLLPLARQFGPRVLDLEARAPGLGGRVFTTFGTELAPAVARETATEDLPRLLLAAERADCPATRAVLWKNYQQSGRAFLERIDWRVVMAAGTSAALINATHRATAPLDASGDIMRENPEVMPDMLAGVVGWAGFGWGVLPLAVVGILLWRFGLMPWHRPRAHDSQPDPRCDSETPRSSVTPGMPLDQSGATPTMRQMVGTLTQGDESNGTR